MKLKGIIIVEGADGAGKTTLAESLARRFDGIILHQGYRFRSQIFTYHTAVLKRAIELSKDRLVILDRLWLSEAVYAEVYRSGTPWPLEGRIFDRTLIKHGAVNIFCLISPERASAHMLETKRHEYGHLATASSQVGVKAAEVATEYLVAFNGEEGEEQSHLYHRAIGGMRQRGDVLGFDWTRQSEDQIIAATTNLLLNRRVEVAHDPLLAHCSGDVNCPFTAYAVSCSPRVPWPLHGYAGEALKFANYCHADGAIESETAYVNVAAGVNPRMARIFRNARRVVATPIARKALVLAGIVPDAEIKYG